MVIFVLNVLVLDNMKGVVIMEVVAHLLSFNHD